MPATDLFSTVLAIRAGAIGVADVIHRCLTRIERLDGRVHAWAAIDRAAVQAQAETLAKLSPADAGQRLLLAAPLGVKDIIDAAGMPTRLGMPAGWATAATSDASREEGSRPIPTSAAAADAPLVAALRAQGAIVLGKTVTTPLAYLDPPPTRNPWNLAHTPGGSSSGSAAAVATGMCLLSIGTQTGGSVIRPAAYCGVVGFKPGFGRLPTAGIFPLSVYLDTPGVLVPTAVDAALVWEALARQLPALPVVVEPEGTASSADRIDLASWHAALLEASSAPLRIGVLDGWFQEAADGPTRAALAAACKLLSRRGARLVELSCPIDLTQTLAMHHVLMAAGAASVHGQRFVQRPKDFVPRIAELIQQGLTISPSEINAALADQRMAAQRVADALAASRCDVWLTPAAPTAAPARLDTTGDARFNAPWTYAGVPALCLPCGVNEAGVPLGLQLIAAGGREPQLLRAAVWCQQALEWPAGRLAPLGDA